MRRIIDIIEKEREEVFRNFQFSPEGNPSEAVNRYAKRVIDVASRLHVLALLKEKEIINIDKDLPEGIYFLLVSMNTPRSLMETAREMLEDEKGKYLIFTKLPTGLSLELIANEIIERVEMPLHIEVKENVVKAVVSPADIVRFFRSYNSDLAGFAVNDYLKNQDMDKIFRRLLWTMPPEGPKREHTRFNVYLLDEKDGSITELHEEDE